MIGKLIIWIKTKWNQQTCIHTYKSIYRKDNGDSFDKCCKCELIK